MAIRVVWQHSLTMLLCMAVVGGLTLMMGRHDRSESLFYYFRLEDHVSENDLLRLIDRHIDFGFVRDRLKDSYSDTGRPSIDSELLLGILLIGYLYRIQVAIAHDTRSATARALLADYDGQKITE